MKLMIEYTYSANSLGVKQFDFSVILLVKIVKMGNNSGSCSSLANNSLGKWPT